MKAEKCNKIEIARINCRISSENVFDPSKFIKVNPNYQDSLEGLKWVLGDNDKNICAFLFSEVLTNKGNWPGAKNSEHPKIDDEKRTFTIRAYKLPELTLEYMQGHLRSMADLKEKKRKTAKIKRSISKSIRVLHECNIIYHWECEKTYIFLLEKNVNIWKAYNSSANVVPHTLLKILGQAVSMRDRMSAKRQSSGKERVNVDKESARLSAIAELVNDSLADFLRNIILKMEESISEELLSINYDDYDGDVVSYIGDLSIAARQFGACDGHVEADDFLALIPESTAECIKRFRVKAHKDNNPESSVDFDGEKVPLGKEAVSLYEFSDPSGPFDSKKDFLEYFRNYVTLRKREDSEFKSNKSNDIKCVEGVYKLLNNIGRFGDVEFLDSWIQYFVDNELKGDKSTKETNTTVKKFVSTFDKHKEVYLY